MPRPKRMTLDTNLISVDGLKTILGVIEAEMTGSHDKKTNLSLLLETQFLKSVIKERQAGRD